MNFGICLSIPEKEFGELLIVIALSLQIMLRSPAIAAAPSLPGCVHGVFSSIKLNLKYHLFFGAMVRGTEHFSFYGLKREVVNLGMEELLTT